MPRKNIILFTGENRVLRERDFFAWIRAFERKYGVEHVVRLDRETVERDALKAELLSGGLFSTAKLVLLSGFAQASKRAGKDDADAEEGESEKTPAKDKGPETVDDTLLSLLPGVPDGTFVLVHSPALDKRTKLGKALLADATVKNYPVPTPEDVARYVADRADIEPRAARLLVDRTGADIEAVARALDLLELRRPDLVIRVADVEECVPPRPIDSVFPVVDAAVEGAGAKAADALVSLLGRESVYAVLASLVSNLRTYVLVGRLAEAGVSPGTMEARLKTHPFVLRKAMAARPKLPMLSALYRRLLDIDRRVKTGRGIGAEEEGVETMIEAALRTIAVNR